MPVLLFLRALGMGVGSWLSRRSLIELACIALALLAGVQTIRASIDHRSLVKANHRITELTELRKTDRASYEAAQRQADDKNKADVLAKEQQYKRNNDEAVGNLNARLERLRRELSARPGASSGSAGGSNLPQADNPPGAPGQTGVCLTPEELLHGAENEERFDQLITLILKQTR